MNKIYYNGSQLMAYPMPEQSFAEYLAIYQDEAQVIWNDDRSKAKAAALPVLNPEIVEECNIDPLGNGGEHDWPGTIELQEREEFIRDVGCLGKMPRGYILSLPSSAPETKEMKSDNELIAEFMGFEKTGTFYDTTDERHYKYKSELFGYTYPGEWAFHIKWDWLMPVVEKINDCCKTTGYPDGLEICQWRIIAVASNIKLVYFSVVEFIKWHNKQTP
jgi:hypothetical protein